MTRSPAVNQESRIMEIEEQIRSLQENARKDKEELREEIKQNATETRNEFWRSLEASLGSLTYITERELLLKAVKG